MSDMTEQNDQISEQGTEQAKDLAKKAGNKAKQAGSKVVKKVGNKAKKAVAKGGKAVAKKGIALAKKGLAKAGAMVAKLAVKAAAMAAKAVAAVVKALIAAGPVGWIILGVIIVVIIVVCLIWVHSYEEKGSTEGHDQTMAYHNPIYLDETGVIKAVALTEPQAIVDAYYKFIACSSYTKIFGSDMYEFGDESELSDFSALRDYNKMEENFYLSDDFIRSLDEVLHDNSFYYPEQIIKPVYGEWLMLKDSGDAEGEYYTAMIPYDTPTREMMYDEEYVTGFADMVSESQTFGEGAENPDAVSLMAQSQVPKTGVTASTEEGSEWYVELSERNVLDTSGSVDTEPGLWDYGFGSVLEYTSDTKNVYIECSYDSVDIDIDKEVYDPETEESTTSHVTTRSVPVRGGYTAFIEDCDAIINDYNADAPENTSYSYSVPTNIQAILDDTKNWDMSVEANSAAESNYTDKYGTKIYNNHIAAKITDAWDSDIDKLNFKNGDLETAFGNVGAGLYPIKIALVSHAATFSGNIHYKITPAGTDGGVRTTQPLSSNSKASIDHRDPVQTIEVAGGCGECTLTAHRTGNLVTEMPRIEEVASPWGFEYLELYASNYTAYLPEDYKNDKDFMLRVGLESSGDLARQAKYNEKLKFLIDLGFLRLYSGNISLGAVGSVDLASLSNPDSDLSILARLIAAEAGPNKLDELLVGAVFMNRVHSSEFPNTFYGVVSQDNGGQYACFGNGSWQAAKPTDGEIASAIQVMTGQFSIPVNVTGQSADIQGVIYHKVDNPDGFYDHYYCTLSDYESPSNVDRFGRPAPEPSQLESLAASLGGATSTQASASASTVDFSSTAFIGDSLTVGLDNTNSLSDNGALVIATTGHSISDAADACYSSSRLNSSIKTVYLLIGTNDNGMNDTSFKTHYESLLETIESKTGGARVILTSLPPCRNDTTLSATNSNINAKNVIINEIAKDRGLAVLDIHTVLKDSDGQINQNYVSGDGLHLSTAGYSAWFSRIQMGLTSTSIGSDVSAEYTLHNADGTDVIANYTLYDISTMDVITATNMQARFTESDDGLLASIKGILTEWGEAIENALEWFDEVTGELFDAPKSSICYPFARSYNEYEVQSTVYHTMTFTNQVWFSTAQSQVTTAMEEGDGLSAFLFVGKNSYIGSSSLYNMANLMTPGVSTTVEGMISPTDTYYKPLSSYNSAKGYMEVSTPAGTNLLAVADGTVISVIDDPMNAMGKNVTIAATLDGVEYEITYGYLATISVVEGASVGQGDLIGTSGTNTGGANSTLIAVKKDDVTVDPSTIFYQATFQVGASLGGNLNNADGTVNEDAIAALEAELLTYAYTNAGYLTNPLNHYERFQCTWWGKARGLQYLMEMQGGRGVDALRGLRHHGGEWGQVCMQQYNAGTGGFAYGNIPKPNSLVSWPDRSGPSTERFGHVAFVEAVDYVNQVYYFSEAGSEKFWGIVGPKSFDFCYYSSSYGQYEAPVFIYLDQPLYP